MAILTSQMQAELEFWRGLVGTHGEYYYAYRVAEYYEKTRYFPSFPAQQGSGADIGCGCISVFEGSSKALMDGFDVLASEYNQLHVLDTRVQMLHIDRLGELGFDAYEWLACINMIDHTPDPRRLLETMRRVLPPAGRLYFEVNLEAGIAPPHYSVWTESTVAEMMWGLFRETHRFVQDVPEHNQRRYWAEFVSI